MSALVGLSPQPSVAAARSGPTHSPRGRSGEGVKPKDNGVQDSNPWTVVKAWKGSSSSVGECFFTRIPRSSRPACSQNSISPRPKCTREKFHYFHRLPCVYTVYFCSRLLCPVIVHVGGSEVRRFVLIVYLCRSRGVVALRERWTRKDSIVCCFSWPKNAEAVFLR